MGFAGYNLVWFIIRPASKRLPFSCGLCGPFLNLYVVCPAVNVFPPFVGFAGYNLFWFVIRPAFNDCPLFRVGVAGDFNFVSYLICC